MYTVSSIEDVTYLFADDFGVFYTAEVRFEDSGEKYKGTFVIPAENDPNIYVSEKFTEFGLIERSSWFEAKLNPRCAGWLSISPLKEFHPIHGFFMPEIADAIEAGLTSRPSDEDGKPRRRRRDEE